MGPRVPPLRGLNPPLRGHCSLIRGLFRFLLNVLRMFVRALDLIVRGVFYARLIFGLGVLLSFFFHPEPEVPAGSALVLRPVGTACPVPVSYGAASPRAPAVAPAPAAHTASKAATRNV